MLATKRKAFIRAEAAEGEGETIRNKNVQYRRNYGNSSLIEHLSRDAVTQDVQPFRAE